MKYNNMERSYKHNIEQKNPDPQKHLQHDSI